MDTQKREIEETLIDHIEWNYNGNLLRFLNALLELPKGKYKNIFFKKETYFNEDYPVNDGLVIERMHIVGVRLETDEEFHRRMNPILKEQEKDYKLYLELKEKFENENY